MKTFIKLGFCFLLCLFFIGCSPEPLENYNGGVVYAKEDGMGNFWDIVTVKTMNHIDTTKMLFVRVKVLEFDFNKYELGDTIRKNK